MKLRFERWIPVVLVLLAVPFLMAQVVNRPGASGGGGGSGASSNYVDSSVQTASNSLVSQISAAQVWALQGGVLSNVTQSQITAIIDYNSGSVILSPEDRNTSATNTLLHVIAIGDYAADGNHATEVIALGGSALSGGTTGSDLIAIGDEAGSGLTNGTKVVVIGANALAGVHEECINCWFLGNFSGMPGNSSLTNVFALGDYAAVSANNQMVIGSDTYDEVRIIPSVLLSGNWRVPDTNGLGGFVNFKASTNSGSAVLYASGSPGSATVRTNGNGLLFSTPGASDFAFMRGVTTNLSIVGIATLNITNGVIMAVSGP